MSPKKKGLAVPTGYDTSICPRCGVEEIGFAALSRADNKTQVCSRCGTDEALIQFFGHVKSADLPQPKDWPVALQYAVPEAQID